MPLGSWLSWLHLGSFSGQFLHRVKHCSCPKAEICWTKWMCPWVHPFCNAIGERWWEVNAYLLHLGKLLGLIYVGSIASWVSMAFPSGSGQRGRINRQLHLPWQNFSLTSGPLLTSFTAASISWRDIDNLLLGTQVTAKHLADNRDLGISSQYW